MNLARQTITNNRDTPIYISIEPTPDCYELEPGDTLTLKYHVPDAGEAFTMFVIEEGLSILPLGDEPEVLINGMPGQGRSWNFKHPFSARP